MTSKQKQPGPPAGRAFVWLALAGVLAAGLAAESPGVSAAASPPGAATIAPERFESQLALFIDRHCLACHDEARQRGGLVLEDREPHFDGEAAALWTRVYEKLEAGEMPPPKRKRRPPEEDVRAVLAWLGDNLRAADLAHRSSIRRLNRFEYENTIRDLLGVDVALASMLPEDGVSHGFDNVGSALSISTELMSAYLEAADRAIDAALGPAEPPEVVQEMLTLEENARTDAGAGLLDTGDGVVVFNSGGYVATDFPFEAPLAGDYRLRVSARTWQSDEPLVMVVRTINYEKDLRSVVGFFEVGSESRTHEMVHRLVPGDQIKITPYRLGTRILYPSPALYPGPGIAIQGLEIEGPLRDQWPPRSREDLLAGADLERGTAEDAERILAELLPRAFRRPVEKSEMAPYLDLVERTLAEGRRFEEGLRIGLQAVLCSPEFLFLGDPEHRPGEPLDDWALASRLSYFLWSTMPDEELLAETAAGRLRDPGVLDHQVERMLADPKAAAFTENFTGQWLDLRLIDFTTPDEELYPEFDELLHLSMVEETERFFQEILDNDLSLLNFVDSGFSMLNGRLADHYGIGGVDGLEFRRVSLPADSKRGGVLTHASVLRITANGTNTSPVLRGVWVLENILGQPAPPPPPGVGAVEPDTRGATTIREQLDLHRNVPSCASCHVRIDPPGLALESFDVIGGWREHYRSMMGTGVAVDAEIEGKRVRYKLGQPVDSTGSMPDGAAFTDIDGFKRLLLRDRDQIARGLTRKLYIYASGRELGFADRDIIEGILDRVRAEDYGFRTLIHEIVRTF